jgi:hypothetical protein
MVTSLELLMILIPNIYLRFQEEEMVLLDSLKTTNTVSWALSGGWNIANEEFMSNVKLFSDLKLRASIGTSGNDRVGDFAFSHYTLVVLVELIMAPGFNLTHLKIKIQMGAI